MTTDNKIHIGTDQYPGAQKVYDTGWFGGPYYVPAIAAAAIVLMLLVVGHLHFREGFRGERLAQEQASLQQLSVVRAHLESYLNGDLYGVKGLVALPLLGDDIDDVLFTRVAGELVASDPHILSLQLAPNGIVKHVWPYEQNKRAIGHNLLGDPARVAAAQRAIDERRFWVAGPVKLIQGGTAIIGRYPIFVPLPADGSNPESEQFWGFATILIDWLSLVGEIKSETDQLGDMTIAIRGKDGFGSEGDLIFGQPDTYLADPMLMDISLPGGSWELAGLPANGWVRYSEFDVRGKAIYGFFSTLLVLVVFFAMKSTQGMRRELSSEKISMQTLEQTYQEGLKTVPQAFAVFGPDEKLIVCNRHFERDYSLLSQPLEPGISIKDLLRKSIEAGLYQRMNQDLTVLDRMTLLEQKYTQFQNRVPYYDDTLRDGRVIRTLQSRTAAGGVAILHVDITDVRVAECERAEERDVAKKMGDNRTILIEILCQELRKSLSTIGSAIYPGGAQARAERTSLHPANQAIVQAEAMLSLIQDTQDLNQIEDQRLTLQPHVFQYQFLMDEVVAMVRAVAKMTSTDDTIELAIESSPNVPDVCFGDFHRIRQVLSCLASALAGLTRTETIRMSVEWSENEQVAEMTFILECSPSASNAEMLAQFFGKRSSRYSPASRHGALGIRVALCLRLVHAMGGRLSLCCSESGGQQLVISVPVQDAAIKPIAHGVIGLETNQEVSRPDV